jgi:hypothetical protein
MDIFILKIKIKNNITKMIILQCVKEKSKLRIKFLCYIDNGGKLYRNVYNNEYNCQFPKDIREEGRYYRIEDDDLRIASENITPFYRVSKNNIKILNPDEILHITSNTPISNAGIIKIYDVNECVVCMEKATEVVFVPCAHKCICFECYIQMKKGGNVCPLCRSEILQIIKN